MNDFWNRRSARGRGANDSWGANVIMLSRVTSTSCSLVVSGCPMLKQRTWPSTCLPGARYSDGSDLLIVIDNIS